MGGNNSVRNRVGQVGWSLKSQSLNARRFRPILEHIFGSSHWYFQVIPQPNLITLNIKIRYCSVYWLHNYLKCYINCAVFLANSLDVIWDMPIDQLKSVVFEHSMGLKLTVILCRVWERLAQHLDALASNPILSQQLLIEILILDWTLSFVFFSLHSCSNFL